VSDEPADGGTDGTDDCSGDAICTDTACGFTCQCKDGYTGDGKTCTKDCSDRDDDGVCDDADNCPDDANADQRDWNGNGVGDACEDVEFTFTGGSCSASPASSGQAGGGLAILAVLAGLALAVRRRLPFRGVAGILAAATVIGAAGSANAQSLDVQAFRPSPFAQDLFTVGTGQTKAPCWWCAGLYLNYQNEPLVLRAVDGKGESIIRRLVEHQITANLLASFTLADWFALGLDVPVIAWQDGQDLAGFPSASAFGMGDIRIYPRFRLANVKDGLFTLGFEPTIIVPVGGFIDKYMGRNNVAFLPTLQFGLDFGRGGLAINAGVLASVADADFGNLDMRHMLHLKAGAWGGVVKDKLDLLAEVSVATPLTDAFQDLKELPVEVLGGLTWHATPNFDFNLGAGGGITKGATAPAYRVFTGFQFHCAPKAPPPPACVPDPDGDRLCSPCVFDQGREAEFAAACKGRDQCPAVAEDFDGFQDGDGCADPDNDQNGICDPWVAEKGQSKEYAKTCRLSDKCPDEPEDKDGFEDDDGCPDCDNDKDRICDPWVVEKGLEAKCGCKPVDKCPNEPENYNTFQDDDGCPDKAVEVTNKAVLILQEVLFYFDKTTIKEQSFPLLDEVIQTLKDNPQLKRLEIQAHTDERGNDGYNLKLSKGRAKEVFDYCVKNGIDPKRLTSRGFGETQPVVKGAKTEEDHQRNRRVVFKILEQD